MKSIAFYSRAFYTGGMENAVYNMCLLLNKTGEYNITILFNEMNDMTVKMMSKLSTVANVNWIGGQLYNVDVLINCDRKDFTLPNVYFKKCIHWFSSCLIQNIDNIKGQVISQSNWHYNKLKQLGIESKVVGNPLDVTYILNNSLVKVEMLRKNNEIVYLIVARISNEKGYDRAVKFMQDRFRENSRLFIIGSPTMPNSDMLVRRIQLALKQKVVFLGEKDNPYPYMLQADYILCLSDNEIYGLVSEEAHILGKQVIFNRYESAKDQFIENYDMWYDMPIIKKDNRLDDFSESAKHNNQDRFKKWKEIIDE